MTLAAPQDVHEGHGHLKAIAASAQDILKHANQVAEDWEGKQGTLAENIRKDAARFIGAADLVIRRTGAADSTLDKIEDIRTNAAL